MKKLVIIVAGLGVLAFAGLAAAIGITMLRSDDPDLLTEAPVIPTTGLDVAPTATSPAPAVANNAGGVFRFVIDQSGSEVKYVVRETLRGVVGAFAVGTTNAITGEIHLTPQGLAPGATSKFSVDLRQLKTDESLRDNFVRQSVLRTNQFPTADFVAESITGFPPGYIEGQEAAMALRGNLTIRGVTKPVEWTVKARRAGDTLTGIADLRFNMTDFGITPPNVPTAQAENGVQLQITILAKLAA